MKNCPKCGKETELDICPFCGNELMDGADFGSDEKKKKPFYKNRRFWIVTAIVIICICLAAVGSHQRRKARRAQADAPQPGASQGEAYTSPETPKQNGPSPHEEFTAPEVVYESGSEVVFLD